MEIPKVNSVFISRGSPIEPGSQNPINTPKDRLAMGSRTDQFVQTSPDVEDHLIVAQPQLTERMKSVFDRLDGADGWYLVNSELLQKEEFLSFAEGLSDADLHNFTQTIKAMHTSPTQKTYIRGYDYEMASMQDFFENLQAMDNETRTRALQKSAELSAAVPPYEPSYIYNAFGQLAPGSDAVNPLYNFVRAINTIEPSDIDEQTDKLLSSFQSYSGDLQNKLLQIAGEDAEAASQIMERMHDFSAETQEEVFSYLAELAMSIDRIRHPPPKVVPDKDFGEAGWQGAPLGIHADSRKVVVDTINAFVSLVDNYLLNDKQIKSMTSDLSGLDNENQRTYLAITQTALGVLLGEDNESQQAVPTEVLEVVDALHNNSEARLLVSESSVGDMVFLNGRTVYEARGEIVGKRDEKQLIEVLTANAWFNRETGIGNDHLVVALRQLGADQRDSLVDDLEALSGDSLYHSASDRQDKYRPLMDRLTVINNSSDASELLEAEEKLPEDSVDNFWRAGSFLKHESDTFVDIINRSSSEGAQLLVGLIVSLSDAVEHNEMTNKEAQEQAQATLAAFSL